MKYWLFVWMMILGCGAQAQGLYRGGKGGGGASAVHPIASGHALALKLYTPAGVFLTSIKDLPATSMQVRVYDCLGRQLHASTLPKGSTQFRLPGGLARGVYMVVVEADRQRFVERVVL